MSAAKRPKLKKSELKDGTEFYHYRRPSTLILLKKTPRYDAPLEENRSSNKPPRKAKPV